MPGIHAYNESPRGLGVAAVAALVLMVAGGLVWFNTAGEARLAAADAAREKGRQDRAAETREIALRLTAARAELAEAEGLRGMRREHAAYLESRIDEMRESIRSTRDAEIPYRAEIQARQAELADQRRERMQVHVALHDLDDRLAERRTAVRSMEQRARDQEGRLLEARRRLTTRETTRFPERSGVSSLLAWRDGRPAILFGVSQDLLRLRRFDLGVQGALGRARAESATLVEAGLYLSLPLRPRRVALDLAGGVGRWQAPRGESLGTHAFTGLFLRWAPLRSERAWLVAGLHYSEELALRLGASLGR